MFFRLLPVVLLLVVLLTTAQIAPPNNQQPQYEPPGIAFQDTIAMLVVLVRFQDDYWGDCGRWWCHIDSWPHTDFLGSGRDIPRTRLPQWASTLLEPTPEDVTAENLSFSDSTLSAYFYWQSRRGTGGPHILYGDVWPEVYITERPNADYYNRRDSMGVEVRRNRGFGHLTEEMLTNLVADGLDLGRYDHDRNGVVDHVLMVFRRDSLYKDQGWATLNGYYRAFGAPDRDSNRRPDTLRYWSPSRQDSVRVDYAHSGSQNFGNRAKHPLFIHEYAHRLMDFSGHIPLIPVDETAQGERRQCGFARMCGAPATYDDASVPFSVFERRRMGWVDPVVLRPEEGDVANVTIGDLYTVGDAVLIPLGEGAAGDTLEIGNRQRIGFFDRHRGERRMHPNFDLIFQGLAANGLQISVSSGNPRPSIPRTQYRYGLLPADGDYEHQSLCIGALEGCKGPWVFVGDLYAPDTTPQLTPWTRPNTGGYLYYPESAFMPQWFAVDNIRYASGPDSTMQFDFVSDVRRRPSFLPEGAPWPVFRADSWLGTESDGLVFDEALITEGVTVLVGADTSSTSSSGFVSTGPVSVTFREGVLLEPGATIIIGAEASVYLGDHWVRGNGEELRVHRPFE